MYPSDDQPPFRRAPKKTNPQGPKGHEAFLKALETAGAVVTMAMLNGDIRKGTVKTSDKYTISLKETREDGSYQVYVIFKHAIEEYWTDPADQPTKQAA